MKFLDKYWSFIKESNDEIEDVILFHGSKASFDEFDETMISSGDGSDLFGKGFYLTNNEAIAMFYGTSHAMKDYVVKYTPTGVFGTEEPVFKPGAEERANKDARINKFRLRGRILNARDFLIDKDFQHYISDLFGKLGGWGYDEGYKLANDRINYVKVNKSKITQFRGELEWIIKRIAMDREVVDGIMNYIKELGYDGIKYESDKSYEGEGSWNYVIFNKNVLSKP